MYHRYYARRTTVLRCSTQLCWISAPIEQALYPSQASHGMYCIVTELRSSTLHVGGGGGGQRSWEGGMGGGGLSMITVPAVGLKQTL